MEIVAQITCEDFFALDKHIKNIIPEILEVFGMSKNSKNYLTQVEVSERIGSSYDLAFGKKGSSYYTCKLYLFDDESEKDNFIIANNRIFNDRKRKTN